jgi:rRNA processing protein Krr1/Pno1
VPCAVYVELNPIRAKLAESLKTSELTSIQDRVLAPLKLHTPPVLAARERVEVLVTPEQFSEGTFSTQEYLKLVSETAKEFLESKNLKIGQRDALLDRLGVNCGVWTNHVRHFGRRFKRVAGTAASMREAAEKAGKNWYHGICSARTVFT